MLALLFLWIFNIIILRLKIHLRIEISWVDSLKIFTHSYNLLIILENVLISNNLRPHFLFIEWIRQLVFGLWIFLLKDLPGSLEEGKLRLKLTFKLWVIFIIIVDLIIIAVNFRFSLGFSVSRCGFKRL
jgi:hypothetical protein